jgi:hypothetical protein
MAASRNGWLTVPPFSSAPQAIGWTPALPAPEASKTPSRHLHASERRGYAPAHGSLQSALLFPTVRARGRLLFPVSDGPFQRLAHGLLTGLLDLLFHLG